MFLIFYILLLFLPQPVFADTGHIIISEIQAYGQTADDEFIRLYNPTGLTIDISGWRLEKKTSSSPTSTFLGPSFSNGTIIPPNSDFLIVRATYYLGSETADATYPKSYYITDNNTIILRDAAGNVIDEANSSTAANPAPASPETPAAANPSTPTEPTLSSANYGDIVINEVVPNPSDGKEWIELYNTTANVVSLAGWKISDGSSVIYEPDGQITGGGFFTAEVNNRLNNPGDTIYLSICFADGSEKSISQLIYGDWANATISAPEKGQSLARLPAPDAAGYGGQARDASGNYQITGTPTKNSQNQFTKSFSTVNDFVNISGTTSTPADLSSLSIIEILPDPEGSDLENEYIKLKNFNDNDIDLGGLYLDDAEGGSSPYKIPVGTLIKAEEEIIFYRSKTKIALNNTDDEARILSGNKEEIFSIDYEDTEEGAIYKLQNETWQWLSPPVIARSDSDEAISANTGLPRSARNDTNSITATVLIPPNIFSTQTMYVDGLQLYMYNKDWPKLAVGDKIYAFGTPSTYYSEPRLKLKDKNSIKIISQNNAVPPAPAENISEDDLGRLIIIEGEVLQIANTKIIINANGEEIPVYDKTKQKLFSQLKEKDWVQITGIVSQYKDEFRLLPRGEDDIKILKSFDPIAASKSATWQYLISTLAVGTLGGAIYFRRKKQSRGLIIR